MAVDYAALKKGGFMRQIQKNQFSMRLKIVGGNLTSAQLSVIAAISEKYGEGRVHFTSRQSVEIPFIKLEDIDAVKAELTEGGIDTSTCGPRVRTVPACQGIEICPAGCIETYPLAIQISNRYFGKELPHKFKMGISGCMNNCLKAESNDFGIKGVFTVELLQDNCTMCGVCIKACREGAISRQDEGLLLDESKCNNCGRCVKSCPFDAWKGEPGYMLSFGGAFGNLIAKGEECLPVIRDTETLFRVADAALAFFSKHANPGERFRVVIDRVGWEKFKEEMEAAYNG